MEYFSYIYFDLAFDYKYKKDLFVTDKTEKKKILIINFYYDFSEIAKNVSDEPDGNEDLVDKIETLIAKFEKQYLMLDAQS